MARLLQHLTKAVMTTVAVLAISLNINAQEWFIYGEFTWSAPHPVGDFHEHLYQGEAVTINGLEYNTIEVVSEATGNHTAGAFRNEDNQVYFCNWNGASFDDEVLLYDYDLTVGEFFHDDDDHPMQVTEVTTIIDNNGVSRKKISFEFLGLPDASEFWIEGVGSSRGFIYVGMYEAAHNSNGEMYHLLCYHVNDNVVYVNPEYNDCDIDDVEENALNNEVGIYPNPANSTIKILNNSFGVKSVEILDLTGRTVLSTTQTDDIDISEIAEGQYFVRIIGENTIVRKLFVTK